MAQLSWHELVLPAGNEDLIFEFFHENSKIGRHTPNPPLEDVRKHLELLQPSLSYEGYPRLNLPQPIDHSAISLFRTMRSRVSVRTFTPSTVSIETLATLLHYSYGVTRTSEETGLPRGFRMVPSGGGLYPLELYLHTAQLEGHESGLYHYNPEQTCLRHIRSGDATQEISKALIQPDIGRKASLLIFITALFERSTFKYQDRGYRFALIEAGHVAQNLNLVANALGYESVNIGGFFDREIDTHLGIDGVTHSTIYMIAIGKRPTGTDGDTVPSEI